MPFVRGSSRPNVLVELGWFWARLGLGRTFVLRDERVSLPSDLGGIWHETYRSDVLEAKDKLAAWLDGLPEAEASAVTEVVHSTSGPQRRDWEYAEVHSAARSSLIVTGIGMINVRQRIPAIVSRLKREPELEVDFVTLDREFVRENRDLLEVMYRPGLDGDLERFDDDLRRHIAGTDLAGRLRLHKSAGIMTFVATAADLDAWGSIMLVETILPVGGYEMIERPRLLLRRRCRDGLYDRFAGATRALLDEAGEVDLS